MVERTKEQQAAELLQILKKGLSQSDSTAAKFLCGLMTGGEIEDLLKRDAVHTEITKSLAEKGKLSMQAVAKKCSCSTELVGRVWDAICNEYPSETATPAQSRIAIPKEERAQKLVKEILLENSFRIDIQDERTKTGIVIDMTKKIAPIPCQIIAGQDMFRYLNAGAVQAGFVGNDKIRESTASAALEGGASVALSVKKQFRVNAFRMCFAIPKEEAATAAPQGLNYLNDKVIVTSYPATAKKYLQENGVEARDIITVKGGVDQACRILGGGAIMDVVESGNSIKRNGLVTLGEPVYPGDMSLISIKGARAKPPLSEFINRLG